MTGDMKVVIFLIGHFLVACPEARRWSAARRRHVVSS
jgi:hypothetical protein